MTWRTGLTVPTIGLLMIMVFSAIVLTQTGSATFHLHPCSEPHDDADVTIYLNETVPDDVEDLPHLWSLNRTYYFSDKPHAIRLTDVEVPKLWMERNRVPGLQMEKYSCLDDDGRYYRIPADTPMDWWVSP